MVWRFRLMLFFLIPYQFYSVLFNGYQSGRLIAFASPRAYVKIFVALICYAFIEGVIFRYALVEIWTKRPFCRKLSLY